MTLQEVAVDNGSEALHAMARQKVQSAIAKLGGPSSAAAGNVLPTTAVSPTGPVAASEPTSADPVLQEAIDRMRDNLGDVCALDRDGRELTWAELARVVIGPLGARIRDADTAAALLQALTPPTTTPEHIYADLLAEQGHGPERVVSQLETLDNGAHRYVFRAGDRTPWGAAAEAGEDHLLMALERRYL